MTEEHSQYFTYRTAPDKQGECIACKEQTHDFMAYSPPGMIPLERACCRDCVQGAFETMRELAEGFRAAGRAFARLRALLGNGE